VIKFLKELPFMDRIKVDLLHYTPDFVATNAVKKPYKNERATIETSVKVASPPTNHGSVIEHVVLNFNISGISRLCLAELMRHRMSEFEISDMFSSATVESTRYTLTKLLNLAPNDIDIWDYFVKPIYDEKRFKSIKEYNEYITELKLFNKSMVDIMKVMTIENITNDFIKYFLIEGWRVDLAFTINLRSFLNFISLRNNPRAHFEIRQLARLMLETLEDTYLIKYFPNY